MRSLVLILAFLLIAIAINAQTPDRRNSLILESNIILTLSLSYDRIIPVSERTAIMLGGDYLMGVGFGYGSHWLAPEVSLLSFGPRHFLESGVLYVFSINPDAEGDSGSSPGIRVAYRLQLEKGLTLRATANALFNIDPIFIPSIGCGYSF